jgi:hypothetical protein
MNSPRYDIHLRNKMRALTQSYLPRLLSILLPGSHAPQMRASRHLCVTYQPCVSFRQTFDKLLQTRYRTHMSYSWVPYCALEHVAEHRYHKALPGALLSHWKGVSIPTLLHLYSTLHFVSNLEGWRMKDSWSYLLCLTTMDHFTIGSNDKFL